MKVVHINNTDLAGRRFNGHDMQLSLNAMGHEAYQFVMNKTGNEPTTIPICGKHELFIWESLIRLEHELSMNGLLYPFGKRLCDHSLFQSADIAHYHLIHNYILSVLDYPALFRSKPYVWTVHDPWMLTGHCVYPRECTGWETGCFRCPQLDDAAFPMAVDKAADMWRIKKRIYREIDPDIIVASRFMEEYIKASPLTAHFTKIHRIPFGIQLEQFQSTCRDQARNRWSIPNGNFVISFRAEPGEIKGLRYIVEMLHQLESQMPVSLLTVGSERLPKDIRARYHVIELGWQHDPTAMYDFYAAGDVFLMPSLAESFGLMAIEAMAAGCPIVVFENTVLPEITFAPECGIAVPYKNSDRLRAAVERLIEQPDERQRRGERGRELARMHYRYEDYVRRHLSLYEEVLHLHLTKTGGRA